MEPSSIIREEKSFGCLVLLRPDGSQRSKFPLTKNKIIIGRCTTSDVRIYDLSVSKVHAELVINTNHYIPARLVAYSPNGIVLPAEKKRISKGEGCSLASGAVFQIAGRPFRYEAAQSAEELILVESPKVASPRKQPRFSLVSKPEAPSTPPKSAPRRSILSTFSPFSLFGVPTEDKQPQGDLMTWSEDEQTPKGEAGDDVNFDEVHANDDSSDSEDEPSNIGFSSTPSRRTSLRMTIRPSPNVTPVKPAPVVVTASPSSFSSSSSEGQTSDEEISDLLISPRQAATFPLPPSPDESTFPSQTSPTQPSHLAQVAAQPLTPIAPARLPTSLARRHSLREKVLIRSAVKAHHNRGLVRSASLGSSPSRPLFAGGMVRSQSTGSVIAGDEDSDSSSDEEVPLSQVSSPVQHRPVDVQTVTVVETADQFDDAEEEPVQAAAPATPSRLKRHSVSEGLKEAFKQLEVKQKSPGSETVQPEEVALPTEKTPSPKSEKAERKVSKSKDKTPSPRSQRALRRSSTKFGQAPLFQPGELEAREAAYHASEDRKAFTADDETDWVVAQAEEQEVQHRLITPSKAINPFLAPIISEPPVSDPVVSTPAMLDRIVAIQQTPEEQVIQFQPLATPLYTGSKRSPRKSALKPPSPLEQPEAEPVTPVVIRKRKSVVFNEEEMCSIKAIPGRSDPEFLAEQASLRKRRRKTAEEATIAAAAEMNDNNDPRQVSPASQESTEQTTPTRASPRLANTPGRARRMVTNTPPAAVAIVLEQMQLGSGARERSTPLPKPRRAVSPSKAAASRLKTDAEKEENRAQLQALLASPHKRLGEGRTPAVPKTAPRPIASTIVLPSPISADSLTAQLQAARRKSLPNLDLQPCHFGLAQSQPGLAAAPPLEPSPVKEVSHAQVPSSPTFSPCLSGVRELMRLPRSPPKTPAIGALPTLFKMPAEHEREDWSGHLLEGEALQPLKTPVPPRSTSLFSEKVQVQEAPAASLPAPRRAKLGSAIPGFKPTKPKVSESEPRPIRATRTSPAIPEPLKETPSVATQSRPSTAPPKRATRAAAQTPAIEKPAAKSASTTRRKVADTSDANRPATAPVKKAVRAVASAPRTTRRTAAPSDDEAVSAKRIAAKPKVAARNAVDKENMPSGRTLRSRV